MLRIIKISFRNFQSVGNITQTVHLDAHGLTLILGENLDASGQRNGAGKTALLNAISYGLFGDALIDDIKLLDQLVNHFNNKDMWVSVTFEVGGKTYVIERGRKPTVLKLFVDGSSINLGKGNNNVTQADIQRIIGMSHLMFKHVVALTTYTAPFLKLKTPEQRAVIEELLGITQLSQRAASLKLLMDQTKEDLRDAEATIKASNEANSRIEQAIDRAKNDAAVWQQQHDNHIAELQHEANKLATFDFDAEMAVFDQIEVWQQRKQELDLAGQTAHQQASYIRQEITRLNQEIYRHQQAANDADSTELGRLAAQHQRYLAEAKTDIAPQCARLRAEAARRQQEAGQKIKLAERLADDLSHVQHQLANPQTHTCSTCGQTLEGTDHLQQVITRLERQVAHLTTQIEQAMADAAACNEQSVAVEDEIGRVTTSHNGKVAEAQTKAAAVEQEMATVRQTLHGKQQAAALRVMEITSLIEQATQRLTKETTIITEVESAIAALGRPPVPHCADREAVWQLRQDQELLAKHIADARIVANPLEAKIEGLQSTLLPVDYTVINECNRQHKHEAFLYKLLTAKDSFVRKKMIDRNLHYLNRRINHYLERLQLPHELRFLADLSVEIFLLGRDTSFGQLSHGEQDRVVLAMWWAFRDVYENINDAVNLLMCDEVVDSGLDDVGGEAALVALQQIARERNKNVFLISHKEALIGRADRVMLVRKENHFTSYTEDYEMAA